MNLVKTTILLCDNVRYHAAAKFKSEVKALNPKLKNEKKKINKTIFYKAAVISVGIVVIMS